MKLSSCLHVANSKSLNIVMNFTKKKIVIGDKVTKYLTRIKASVKNFLRIEEYYVVVSHPFELKGVSLLYVYKT